MLRRTIEQMSLTVPSDAVELSFDELEEVNGAKGYSYSFPFKGNYATFLSAIDYAKAISSSVFQFAKFWYGN
jgi:hypothetical protein